MAIFNSYVKLPEGKCHWHWHLIWTTLNGTLAVHPFREPRCHCCVLQPWQLRPLGPLGPLGNVLTPLETLSCSWIYVPFLGNWIYLGLVWFGGFDPSRTWWTCGLPEVELENICRIFETAGQIWALQGSMVVLRNEHDGKHSNRGNTANATNTIAHTP